MNDILTSTRGSPLLHVLYSSCMDTAQIERLGVQPLLPYLHPFSNATDWPTFAHALGRVRSDLSVPVVLQSFLYLHFDNSQEGYLRMVPATSTATGLTYSRASDYANSSRMEQFRAAAERLLTRAGLPLAAERADGARRGGG